MSLDAMKQALAVLEEIADEVFSPYDNKLGNAILALRAAIEQAQEPIAWVYPEGLEALKSGRPWTAYGSNRDGRIPLYLNDAVAREWRGLTDDEIKAPIQRAMQHFGYDPTQYSLGGMATIGFYGLVKEIEAKLKEKNR